MEIVDPDGALWNCRRQAADMSEQAASKPMGRTFAALLLFWIAAGTSARSPVPENPCLAYPAVGAACTGTPTPATPTPTPSATTTSTSSPSPTRTRTRTKTQIPTITIPIPTDTPTPDITPPITPTIPTPTSPTPSASPTPTPTGQRPSPTPTRTPQISPTATPTSSATPTPTIRPPPPSDTPTPIHYTPTYTPTPTPTPAYKISGRVMCMDGKGMKGILVTASEGGAAVTDAGGNYTIWPLDAGTYYVAPFGGSYQFVPPSQVVTLPPDATGVDFMAFSGGPMITNSPLGGIVCIKYSFPMSASGGLAPYTWSASGLPPGLSINPQTGVISGTPIQDGGYNVTITVKDAAGCTDTKTFKMNIKPNKPFIPAGTLPRGKVCLPYSAALQVTGGCQPYTWMISSGAL